MAENGVVEMHTNGVIDPDVAAPPEEVVETVDTETPTETEGAEGAETIEAEKVETQTPEEIRAELQALRQELSEHKTWREKQEKVYAEEQTRRGAQEPKREYSPQERDSIAKEWGFTTSIDKDTGEKTLAIDSWQMVQTTVKTIERGLQMLEEKMEKRLHENTNSFQMDSVMSDLANRTDAKGAKLYSDIKNYSSGIKEYLKENHHPKDHANEKFILNGLWWAKGRGMKDVVKQIQNGNIQNKKVIHPAPAGGSSRPAATITPAERAMMRGMKGSNGKDITDAEWIKARGK